MLGRNAEDREGMESGEEVPLHSGICGRAVASQKSFDFLYGNDSVWFSNEDCTVFLNDIQRNVHIRYIYILPMEFLLSNPDNDLLVTS